MSQLPRLSALLCALPFLLGAHAAAAQADPMEMQRCIWRCLADSPGAASARYQACVARQCSDAAPAAPSPWASGLTSDGRGAWAGYRDPVSGNQLSWVCTPRGGPSGLVLSGPSGPSATLVLRVDGIAHALDFIASGNGYHAQLAPGAPAMTALVRGQQASLENSAGQPLLRMPLAGAGAAIAQARASCG